MSENSGEVVSSSTEQESESHRKFRKERNRDIANQLKKAQALEEKS